MNGRLHLLVSCLALVLATGASAATLYVSPKGRDSNPGTVARPFATLERARDAARALRKQGPLPGGLVVEVRGGLYELPRPLELSEEDSGTASAPVTWRARAGEQVRLVGGRFVKGWRPVTDPEALARMDPAARGHVWQAGLRAQGITRYGEMKSAPGWGSSESSLEVFFDEKPMTLARWPNQGFTTLKDVVTPNFDVRGTKGSTDPRFYYEGDRPQRWAKEPDVMLHGYWFWDWADQRYRVASIDGARGIITLDTPRAELRKGQWYYAYNLLSELDSPGEWYLDRRSGTLYLWPPKPLDKARVMVSLIPNLVTLKDASHVTFKGFTLEGCQGTAVEMSGGTGNRVAGCVIRNSGGFAVRVEGGSNHGVVGCDLYQMGDGGIVLHGGDARTLTHAGHFADNNHIHHFSRWDPMYKVGIEMVGVGLRASHNLIHHAPHVAISFCGQENVVEYNEIHNVVEGANDAGAIYTQPGADETWTMRGNVVRYNYVHHVYGFRGQGCNGVYLDDCFSSIHCYGNLFYQVPAAVFIGGGRDSVTENNLFVECNPAIHVDARGLGWASSIEPYLRKDLESLPYRQPPWSTRYPQLLTLLQDDPMAPKGNVFARNICWGGRWEDIEDKAKPLVKYQDNLVGTDPLFVNAKRADFRFRPGSPAWKLGFKALPLNRIGLYKDPTRASWPVTHKVDPAPAPPAQAALLRRPNPVVVPRLSAPGGPSALARGGGVKLVLDETNEQGPLAGPACIAHVAHDGERLLVSISVPLASPAALSQGEVWGENDGVEVCLRDASNPQRPGATWVLQGHPSGAFRASGDAGAPAAGMARLARTCRYTARRTKEGWTSEWTIPLAAAGIRPRAGLRLGFNLGVRRIETNEWVVWAGTKGPNWRLDGAGMLVLR